MHMCDNHDRLQKNCKIKLKENKRGKQNKTEQYHRGRSTHKTESRRGWLSNV